MARSIENDVYDSFYQEDFEEPVESLPYIITN